MATDVGSILKVGLVGAAGYLAYRYFFLTPATPATPATPGGAGTGGGAGGSGAAASYNSLASIFSRLSARASKDGVTAASPDQWCAIYTAEGGPGPCPDPNEIFGSHDAITLPAFWAGLSAWLSKTKGLSGLGAYQGLYHLAMGGRLR